MARNTEAMQQLADEHPDSAIECAAVDVRDHGAVKAAVDRMVDAWGGIDVHSQCWTWDFLAAHRSAV